MILPIFRISLLAVMLWYLRDDPNTPTWIYLGLIGGLSLLDNVRSWLMYRYQVDKD